MNKKLNNFEITYLTSEEDTEKIIENIIINSGGIIFSTEFLGKKRLAYKIRKQEFANIYTIRFQIAPDVILTVNKLIQDNPITIRHLIIAKKVLTSIAPVNTDKKDKSSQEMTLEKPTKTEDKKLSEEKKSPKPQTKTKATEDKKAKVDTLETSKETKKVTKDKKITKKPAKTTKDEDTKSRLAELDKKLDEILKD